ncbi:CheY-like superfamily protein [Tanacetum coccineum]|uniref:CheY-like superfamily protein n=1 Tax=Tanacetum coccineum TaxID=301880 RepID=A0ABQ4X7G3_9ASTR
MDNPNSANDAVNHVDSFDELMIPSLENSPMKPLSIEDSFNPHGLKVLVVDNDPDSLLHLTEMLTSCQYQVTTCSLPAEALALIKDGNNKFDIVITEVHFSPDINGVEFLEIVVCETKLHVVNENIDTITECIMKGACTCIPKPAKIEVIKLLGQDVARKMLCHKLMKPLDELEVNEPSSITSVVEDQELCGSSDLDGVQKVDDQTKDQAKKHRMVWTDELHCKFVAAVKHLGIQNAVPKKVTELMNVPGLRRTSVASHLQKYRLGLQKLSTNMQPRLTEQVFKYNDSLISTQLNTGVQQCFTEQDSGRRVPIGANSQVPSGAYHPVIENDWEKDCVVYVLTTPIPENGNDATVEQLRKRAKWDNDDYVCRGLILKAEDVSSKNFFVSNFTNYKMTYSRPIMEQYNELLNILERFTQHKMNMNEAIQVSCIIDKHPPSWKDFKHTLKHNKEELTLVELGSHVRNVESLEAHDSHKLKGNNVVCPWEDVTLPDPKVKTLSQRGIECIFVGYAEHFKDFRFYVIESNTSVSINFIIKSKDDIFDENRFSLVPRPSQRFLIHGTEDIGGLVVHEEVTEEYHKIANFYDIYSQSDYSSDGSEDNILECKSDETSKGGIICLYVDDMLIFGTDQVHVDLTKEFLSSKFCMKDMGERSVPHSLQQPTVIADVGGIEMCVGYSFYRLQPPQCVPIFFVSKSWSACSRVFTWDIYGYHVVSCASIIDIKHRHNMVRDTFVDICFWSGILVSNEVDIGIVGGRDKPLRVPDMFLYSWEGGIDVCVNLTGSSPLTQTVMTDFLAGHVVVHAAYRKRVKYEAKCADIGYGFLPFSFSSFRELDKDAVYLLKRIRKFSVNQHIGACAIVYIFNRISFAIAKGVGAQLRTTDFVLIVYKEVGSSFFAATVIEDVGGIEMRGSLETCLDGKLTRACTTPLRSVRSYRSLNDAIFLITGSTYDWFRVVSISGLGHIINACSRVFVRDIYGDHVVSCAGIIGIKHQHNMVRDTLVDICFWSGISASKEVDIGLVGGRDKPLRSSPLTQTGMTDFLAGHVVVDAAHRKRVKYEAKCADIGYGFLPFSFSSFRELEKDVVNLLKRIRKFSVNQDIGACVVVHIFNRIIFVIAKRVGAQLTMNGKTYRCVLCYRLGVLSFFALSSRSACSRVFTGDIYRDYVASFIETMLHHDIGSSPLTQTRLANFVPGRAVSDVSHQKDAVVLLKRIRKFSIAQAIGTRAAIHIFNRISFAIAKRVRAKIVSVAQERVGSKLGGLKDSTYTYFEVILVDLVHAIILNDPRINKHRELRGLKIKRS